MIGKVRRGIHVATLTLIGVSISVVTFAFLHSKLSAAHTRALATNSENSVEASTNMCDQKTEKEKIYFAGCGGFF